MKKLILFASFLMVSSITNKISAQNTSTDFEATIISISSDKSTGFASLTETGEVIQFVNNILADVLPGNKVLILNQPSRSIPENSRSINDSKKPILSVIR